MANVIAKGTNLPTQIVEEMFNMVRGESALAKLSPNRPIPFNGITEMTFNLDHEASVVGENQPKVNGGATVTPVVIRPYKFEYGVRVSDEFMYGTEEYRMDVLRTFAEGASRKFARALDIGAFHGFNPFSGTASNVIGNNSLDGKVTNYVVYSGTTPDANIDSAIAQIDAVGATANGLAIDPTMRSALASMKANGVVLYPEFKFGSAPETLGALRTAVNQTVGVGNVAHGYVGDFSGFRWGYAKEIPLEVIEYGNPDNDATAGDLKGHNQVYLRAEFFIGWGILAPERFARVTVE
jgi:hypothetical protein